MSGRRPWISGETAFSIIAILFCISIIMTSVKLNGIAKEVHSIHRHVDRMVTGKPTYDFKEPLGGRIPL